MAFPFSTSHIAYLQSVFKSLFYPAHGKRKLYEFFVNLGISVFTIKTIHKDVMISFFCA